MKKLSIIFLLMWISIICISCKNTGEDSGPTKEKIADEKITEAVTRELQHYPEVPAQKIDAATQNSIVTLTGSVSNLLAYEKAEEIASIVRGVEGVINRINVETKFVPDKKLKEDIEAMFYNDLIIERYEISVSVDSGHVILAGDINSWGEKQLSEDIAKYVTGVKSIDNQIKIVYQDDRTDSEIKTDVAGLLQFDVRLDYSDIEVEVNNGIVHLRGTVGSLFEKSKARNLAWVLGVDSVNTDNLFIDAQKRNLKRTNIRGIEKSDKEIKNAVKKALEYDVRVNALDIVIEVEEGYVTLKGSANTVRAKEAAESDANNVLGVWGVKNEITVKELEPKPPKKAITDNTRKTLRLHPYLNPYSIGVEEENGKISLMGKVRNKFDRQLAEDAVSAIPGVVEIENKLEIDSMLLIEDNTTPQSFMKESDLPVDSIIKTNIETELWWSPLVNENDIKVKVDNRKAKLTGNVDNRFEKQQAALNALEGGASEVENDIIVEFEF